MTGRRALRRSGERRSGGLRTGLALLVGLLLALYVAAQIVTGSTWLAEGVPGSAGTPASASAESEAGAIPGLRPASAPLHISYPAVGMDQNIVSLPPQEDAGESIVPPRTLDAYWLASYGAPGPGSTNTTYVVGHSWEDRQTPFNNLSMQSQVGDRLTITTAEGVLDYRVDAITTENKDTLKDSAIWAIVPGRLVLVSCYTADLWEKNIVLVASPIVDAVETDPEASRR